MENTCPSAYVPCAFLRMIMLSLLISATSLYAGNGLWWSLGFGAASLLLMQIGYFTTVLVMLKQEKKRRS